MPERRPADGRLSRGRAGCSVGGRSRCTGTPPRSTSCCSTASATAIPRTISRWAARGMARCCGPSRAGISPACCRAIEEGYFDSLGVHAIWMTPFVEQIHGSVDEGTGKTYGFHGYWTRDWTAVDPALGTQDELRAVVDAAHRRGIRVIMDAVINHTGPPTAQDPAWPDDWVRTAPNCAYRDYATTVDCTLVATLPDIRTERDAPVALPPALLEKWEREGRREREVARARRVLHAHRPPAGSEVLHHQVADRLGARVRVRRVPDRHGEAFRRDGRRRAQGRGRSRARRVAARRIRGRAGTTCRSTWWGRCTAGSPAKAGTTTSATGRWTTSRTGTTRSSTSGSRRDAAGSLDSLFAGYAAPASRADSERRRDSQLCELARRRLALRRRAQGSHGRRHPPPARPGGRADLLR